MATIPRGLHERLITAALQAQLGSIDPKTLRKANLHPADVSDRIATHVTALLRRTIEAMPQEDRVQRAILLARQLIHQINQDSSESLVPPGEVLDAVLRVQPDGSLEPLPTPETPLLDSTILTNSPGEPRVGAQVRSEIPSSDRIDVVMAFVRKSGIMPLVYDLRRHVQEGRALRVLTTTFTGSTDPDALDLLMELGAQIKVSYETGPTRLHAKAWLFHRETGTSTAYVGSSNLTHHGQSSGLEWNVRVSGVRNPDIVAKIAAVFESYWNSGDYKAYDREEFRARMPGQDGADHAYAVSPVELRLEPFQERLLEKIALAREQGLHRNLLVSATGTGKTVMAAVDYVRLRKHHGPLRLLFVAHRDPILRQARATFAHALREPDFGELWFGGQRPGHFDHVFATIQSLTASGIERLDRQHFDVVVIDEFHHAAARTYQELLAHLEPKEFLGLTATPERSDGLPLLEWFGGRIAAELRLWDAIDQHRLTPFQYFGVSDEADLRQIPGSAASATTPPRCPTS